MSEGEEGRRAWEREVAASYHSIARVAQKHRLSSRRLTREYETALAVLVCTVGRQADHERTMFGELYRRWTVRRQG